MTLALYLHSSAVSHSMLGQGLSAEVERRLAEAEVLVTSRPSLVEMSRAFLRVRLLGERPEAAVADAERSVRALWRRCEIREALQEFEWMTAAG